MARPIFSFKYIFSLVVFIHICSDVAHFQGGKLLDGVQVSSAQADVSS